VVQILVQIGNKLVIAWLSDYLFDEKCSYFGFAGIKKGIQK
jgi:hypothetical protein